MSKRTLGLLVACALSVGQWRRAGADDVAGRQSLRPEDHRSDLDHGLHRAQPRLPDLRHAVRAGRQSQVKPQMVDKWSTSDDKLTWTFTLRDGLEFHDGAPVTAEDVVPSLKRWAVRDPLGQMLWTKVRRDEGGRSPRPSRSCSRRRPASCCRRWASRPATPFIMPKRIAETDPFKQIEDATGSGPFIFVKNEWKPGEKTVYVKNPKYKPRQRAAVGPGRRQDRQGRSRRMGGDVRSADGRECADQGRDRHDRIAAARSLQGHGGRQERQAGQPQQVGQPVHLPLQPALQAVRQSPRSARRCSMPSTRRTFSTA